MLQLGEMQLEGAQNTISSSLPICQCGSQLSQFKWLHQTHRGLVEVKSSGLLGISIIFIFTF